MIEAKAGKKNITYRRGELEGRKALKATEKV